MTFNNEDIATAADDDDNDIDDDDDADSDDENDEIDYDDDFRLLIRRLCTIPLQRTYQKRIL